MKTINGIIAIVMQQSSLYLKSEWRDWGDIFITSCL